MDEKTCQMTLKKPAKNENDIADRNVNKFTFRYTSGADKVKYGSCEYSCLKLCGLAKKITYCGDHLKQATQVWS